MSEITWIEVDPRFHKGLVEGKQVFKISLHWTGAWLDCFGRLAQHPPHKCRSLDDAKRTAVELLHIHD